MKHSPSPMSRCLLVVGTSGLALLAPLALSVPAVAVAPATVLAVSDAPRAALTVDTTTYRAGDTVTVTGTAAPGARVGVLFGDRDLVRKSAAADGRWTITSERAVLSTAGLSITVTAGTGNDAETVTRTLAHDTSERPLTVDTTRYRVGDLVTVKGTASPRALIAVVFGGKDSETGRADDRGNWSITSLRPATATNGLSLEVSTGIGETARTIERTLTVDTSERHLTVDTDKYRVDDLVTVSGTAEPGAFVHVRFRSNDTVDSRADDDGNWRITSMYAATATDGLTLQVSTGAGASLRTIEHTLARDTSERPLTVDTTKYRVGDLVTATGTAEPRAFIAVSFGRVNNSDTARADDDGKWSITSPKSVTETDGITLTVSTGTGDSTRTIERALTVDTSERHLTVDTTKYRVGDLVTATGTAEPRAFIAVSFGRVNNSETGRADDDGKWSITSLKNVTETEGITLTVSSGTGSSTRTIERALTVDTSERHLTVDTTDYAPGHLVTVSGTAEPHAFVGVEFGPRNFLDGRADADGDWRITSPKGVTVTGGLQIRVHTGSGSTARTVERTLTDATETDVRVTSPKQYLSGTPLRVEGTARPGATVRISAQDAVINIPLGGAVVASPTGQFSFTSKRSVALSDGDPKLSVTVQQDADAATVHEFRSLQEGVEYVPTRLTSDKTFFKGEGARLVGTASPYTSLSVRVDDGAQEFVRADANGAFDHTTRKLPGESYRITIHQLFGDEDKTTHEFTARDGATEPALR
ncbi:hypothetical protein, partial [Curtobacterium sp. MCBA15_013]|uniref:hypothetical protein n=1 Tax=Curtobacterium sp. MCBA15_013 TaxID=1898739 RepID=UPI0011140791